MAQNNNQNNVKKNAEEEEENVSKTSEETTYLQEIGKQNKPPLPLLLPFIRDKGFELREQIGRGQFSDVYRAYWTQLPGVNMACKRIKLEEVDEDWKEKCLDRELNIIKRLKHKNIIEVYEVFRTKILVYIFMQMADNGSIREYMIKHQHPIREHHAIIWFSGLMAGISYMHSIGVAHRDLKLDNFLLNHEFTALLSDFGFAVMDNSRTNRIMRETMCGTIDYMAPEVLNAGPKALYDAKKADIYSMGVCLYEMINYDKPYDLTALQNNILALIRMKRERNFRYHSKIELVLSKPIKDLVYKLLEPDPQKRITIQQISRLY